MPERTIIASLRVLPSSGCNPITQILTLEQDPGGEFSILERQLQRGRRVSSLRKPLLKEDAETQLSALRGETIPAYPEDTDVLDGSTYVVTVKDAGWP
jgi:hypothetical protein